MIYTSKKQSCDQILNFYNTYDHVSLSWRIEHKMSSFEDTTACCIFKYLWGFSTNVSKNEIVVLTKSQLVRFKATYNLQHIRQHTIRKEDEEKVEIKIYRVWRACGL